MIGPCDCPPEEKPCYLCKTFDDARKRRQAERRKELGLGPNEAIPCKCCCKCPKCQNMNYTECECYAAKEAGDVPALTCCFNRQSIVVEPTFISDGTLDKVTLREHLSYWLWRARCWIEISRS